MSTKVPFTSYTSINAVALSSGLPLGSVMLVMFTLPVVLSLVTFTSAESVIVMFVIVLLW